MRDLLMVSIAVLAMAGPAAAQLSWEGSDNLKPMSGSGSKAAPESAYPTQRYRRPVEEAPAPRQAVGSRTYQREVPVEAADDDDETPARSSRRPNVPTYRARDNAPTERLPPVHVRVPTMDELKAMGPSSSYKGKLDVPAARIRHTPSVITPSPRSYETAPSYRAPSMPSPAPSVTRQVSPAPVVRAAPTPVYVPTQPSYSPPRSTYSPPPSPPRPSPPPTFGRGCTGRGSCGSQ